MPRIPYSERSVFVCALALALGCVLSGTPALVAAEPRAFELVAGEATDTLKEFARQAELQTLFDYQLVMNLQTRAVSGDFEADDALKRMLMGTGLWFERINERTVAIRAKEDRKTDTAPESAAGRTPYESQEIRLTQASTDVPAQGDKVAMDQQSDAMLEEITVTAQKRKERLADVPISISVLRGEDLDKSTAQGVTEALNRVPGVTTTEALQGGGTQLTIRGVTAAGPLFAGANPIAYYLDSLPFGLVKAAITPDSNAYDLDRIEVLRGPQGTLYGASALNGVVRILTKDANLDNFELKARTSGSTTEDGGQNYRADAALNVPLITGKLGARAVVGYQRLDGWLDKPNQRDFNDTEVRNLRLKVNAQPTAKLSAGFSAWLSRSDGGGPAQGTEDRRNSFFLQEPLETNYDAYSLRLGYNFEHFSISNTAGLLEYDSGNDLDAFGPLLFTGLESDVVTEELIATSTAGGPWRWSIGGLYRKGKDRTFQYFITEPGAPRTGQDEWLNRSESYAMFGEATRLFSEGKFELTAGLRYFGDDLESWEGPVGQPPLFTANPKFHATTPRAIFTWHPNNRGTLYASYGEGFRSGFEQFRLARSLLNLPPVRPDTLRNYEVGAKGSTYNGGFSYEAALYYVDWQDVQQALTLIVDNIPRAANTNGDSASGMGVDLSVTTRPLKNLELGASVSWNDLAFDTEVLSADIVMFAAGDRLGNSPELAGSVSADYRFPLGGNGFEGQLSASANYVSEQNVVTVFSGSQGSPGRQYVSVGDDTVIGRASFSIESPSRWTASLFVDNVTDENGTPLAAILAVPDWSLRLRPRTIGLQLEYRFN